ncbi:TolC family outer membrane protein [Duganella violaceipulchra]|uniref:Protease secretion system outer membrane protein n=1 Tax=Duganella violaceipulchra TaxID=2849652 RepID=A0AA41L1A9_9BURK|nr:TolC family outer membrane protein [Duganella violaceicalia]MBV6320443.1 TolC family outer membrane protein [Duganella violaceicalia]MCP2012278.1 protease secretion system outer membrane protein [Duganella violaceicalia]
MRVPRLKPAALLAALLGAGAMLHGASASALGLMEAYNAALKNDTVFRAAYYTNEGGKENKTLGLSGLLPNISASFSDSKNRTDILQTGSAPRYPIYYSRSANIQVRQTLFNLDAWARYKEGLLQTDYSGAVYLSEQQQVMLRVVGAYIEALFKQDQLALARIERDTYIERMKVNDLMFTKGEGTRTDMLETRARLDVAEAALLEAQDNLAATRANLAAIIGGDVGELEKMTPDFRGSPDDTLSFDAWKRVALERNPDLKAKQLAVDINQQEVNKARAGHAPRLDLVGNYGKSTSDSTNTIDQTITSRSVGIQLNIPLYSGGSVNASTRQAVANREKAKAELQTETDKAIVELRKDYDSVISSVVKIDALMKAVDSGRLLVKATEQSIKGGVRINLDLLDAQRQLSATERDLAQARYTYVLAQLKLRAAAGTLSADDVRTMAVYFR